MSASRSIANALSNTSEPVVLATVVRITGSSYGGVGTRMVIPKNGAPIGIVSGGCLESDLTEHAKQVLESRRSKVVTYDTRADDEAAWGLGLGCSGLVDVLLEPLEPTQAHELGSLLDRALTASQPSALATILETEAASPHALFVGDETYTIGWADRDLLEQVRLDSADAFAQSRGGLIRDYGQTTVGLEAIVPSIELIICGSGPDVVPLVKLAGELDWNLTIVDHRPPDSAHAGRFDGAKVVSCLDPLELEKTTPISRFTATVVMSHNYARDLEYVRALLKSHAAYIGVLGPRARTERMLADITSTGESVTRVDRIYSPIGLDTGGDGPQRIALSIVSEIGAVMSNRSGGHLRDSRSPLHSAPVREVAEKT